MIAVAVTMTEGGDWVPFPCKHLNSPEGVRIHSIVFDNGAEWDAYNGWRQPPRREALPRVRVKMGRSIVMGDCVV